MHMDNKVACDIAKAKGLTCKVKHLEVQDAYIRILRERGIMKIIVALSYITMKSIRPSSTIISTICCNTGQYSVILVILALHTIHLMYVA